jgi:hypothetical protein
MPWDDRTHLSPRPVRPREPGLDRVDRQELSRPFRPHSVCRLFPQGIGLRPQPWALFCRPVGPEGPPGGISQGGILGQQFTPPTPLSLLPFPPDRADVRAAGTNKRTARTDRRTTRMYKRRTGMYVQPNDPHARTDGSYEQPEGSYIRTDDLYVQTNGSSARTSGSHEQRDDPHERTDSPHARTNRPYEQTERSSHETSPARTWTRRWEGSRSSRSVPSNRPASHARA